MRTLIEDSSESVKIEAFAESLKVLASPYMSKTEKSMLLSTIQSLFLHQGSLIEQPRLMKNLVEPFAQLFGSRLNSNHINYLAYPKRDIAKEVADEYYPFKPKLQT